MTPVGNRTAGPQKTARQKILRSEKEAAAGRTSSSPGSVQRNFESRQWAEQVRVQAVSRESLSPGSGQNKFKSRQQAEQVRLQAAGTESSSPDSGQSKFESRQISRNQEMPTRASPQRVVYPSIIQRKVSTCSIHAQPVS